MNESDHEIPNRKRTAQFSGLDEYTELDDIESGQPLSRSDKHRSAARGATEEASVKAKNEAAIKKMPWWASSIFWIMRKSIAPIIMIAMLLAGLYIGYVIVGGQSKNEVFEWSTWKHMWDLVFAES